jgi:Calcium-binding EGF domain
MSVFPGTEMGTCAPKCERLCNHQPCLDDYDTNNIGGSCVCLGDKNPKSRCGSNTVCNNDTCKCATGFVGNGLATSLVGCQDVNECASAALHKCGGNATCVNTPGAYTCACKNGYSGDPFTACTDINECTRNSTICGPDGTCSNTIGSYSCSCSGPGYQWKGPGSICENVNECLNSTPCGPHSICTDNPGSVICTCLSGYKSSGSPPAQPCVDTDECSANATICGSNTVCEHTPGSYSCRCEYGYDGNPPLQHVCQITVSYLARCVMPIPSATLRVHLQLVNATQGTQETHRRVAPTLMNVIPILVRAIEFATISGEATIV